MPQRWSFPFSSRTVSVRIDTTHRKMEVIENTTQLARIARNRPTSICSGEGGHVTNSPTSAADRRSHQQIRCALKGRFWWALSCGVRAVRNATRSVLVESGPRVLRPSAPRKAHPGENTLSPTLQRMRLILCDTWRPGVEYGGLTAIQRFGRTNCRTVASSRQSCQGIRQLRKPGSDNSAPDNVRSCGERGRARKR